MDSSSGNSLRDVRRIVHASGVLVAGGILALLLGGVSLPLSAQRRSVQHEIEATERFLATQEAVRSEHERLRSRFTELDARKESILARIPAEANESEFLAQLTRLAEESGLLVQEYRPGTITPHEGYSEMEILVNARADYESVCYFLDGLTRLPRYCQLTDFEMDAASPEKKFPITMKLRIYFKRANS
jgi:type IV pilus assembly protein PilO